LQKPASSTDDGDLIFEFRLKSIAWKVHIACVFLAPLLAAASAVVLCFANNLLTKLILIFVSELTFSVTLAIFTDARDTEIFVATAT
jgi:hypothetical protein